MVLSGEQARAVEIVDSILAQHGSNSNNSWALGRLAKELARVGLKEKALQCIPKGNTFGFAAAVAIDRQSVLIGVIGILARSGGARAALDATDKLLLPEQNPFCDIPILAAVTDGLVKEGHCSLANKVAHRCAALAEATPDDATYVGDLLAQSAGAPPA